MKVFLTAFAVMGLGVMACGGGGFDEAACTAAEEDVNAVLEACGGTAISLSCDLYTGAGYEACDFTAFYEAYGDYYTCDTSVDPPVLDTGATVPSLDCT